MPKKLQNHTADKNIIFIKKRIKYIESTFNIHINTLYNWINKFYNKLNNIFSFDNFKSNFKYNNLKITSIIENLILTSIDKNNNFKIKKIKNSIKKINLMLLYLNFFILLH